MQFREATIPVRFAGGLETKLDEKVVPLGKWEELRNAVFARGGTARKRYGHTELPKTIMGSATPLTSGRALGVRGTELVQMTQDELYTYVDDASAWRKVADVQSVPTSHRTVVNRTTGQTYADSAELDGVAAYAWEDSAGGVYAALLDSGTDAVLAAPFQVSATGSQPRVHAIGSFLHIYYADATNADIRCLVVSPAAPQDASSGVPTFVAEDLNTSDSNYDVCDDGSQAAIVWVKTGGKLGLGYVHESGEIGRPLNGLTAAIEITDDATMVGIAAQSFAGIGGEMVIVLADGTDVTAKFYDGTFALQNTITLDASAANAANVSVAYVDSTGHFFWEESAAAGQNHTVTTRTGVVGGTLGTARTQRSAGLASKAFTDDEHAYAWLVFDSTLFSTYLCQREDGLVVARVLSGLATGVRSTPHLATVRADPSDSRKQVWAGIYKEALESEGNDVFTEPGIRRIELDFDSDQSHQTTEIGRSMYLGGGLLQVYDGADVYPAEFHFPPDDVATPTESGSSGLATGTYSYIYTYERALSNGEFQISATSVAISVSVASGPSATNHTVPTYRYGDDTVRIGVWRSEDGDTSVFYRVTSLDPGDTSGANKYLSNDPTTDTVSFSDEFTDATLITKEPLYTTGGVLSNDPIGSGAVVASGKGRAWTTDPADGDVVQFSQQRRDGYAAEFSPRLRSRMPAYGGDVTGIIEMDAGVVVFKETALYRISGPGPFANPDAGGGFSEPELITSDAGALSSSPIIYTPVGVLYQSKKGIEMLGRQGQTEYIGAPVEKYTDPTRENQTFVAASLVEDRREIRLLPSSGEALLYDYFFKTWSSWDNHSGKDAVTVGGTYHYLRSDGAVWKENPGSYRDVNSQISLYMRTPWIKLAEILSAWQQLWYLDITGKYLSAHTLRVRAYYDFETGHDDEWVLDPSTYINLPAYGDDDYGDGDYGEGGGGDPVQRYQYSLHIGRKCAAVQFTFEFVESTGVYGAAGELVEFVLRGGVLDKGYPQQDARKG